MAIVVDANALIFNLMLTCLANQVTRYEWLTHLFTELPQRETGADITDLLPFNYTKEMAAQNVKG